MNNLRLFFSAFCFLSAFPGEIPAKAVLKGTVSFLNSGSRPAAGVDVSAFGANTVVTTEQGMFTLEFPDKNPGDKVKIIIGSKDRDGVVLELVNDKALAQTRIPSRPEDDILEIIVCRAGQRNEAALRYNGLIVNTINKTIDKRLSDIDEKLGAAKIDAESIVSLQKEKDKLREARDSALAKAEEQALYIASINLDKASRLVREAVLKVDSLQDIAGAIVVLDNDMLYRAYLEANEKKNRAESEIQQVVAGFEFKIRLLEPQFRYAEIVDCYQKIAEIYEKQGSPKDKLTGCYDCLGLGLYNSGEYQKSLDLALKTLAIREKILPADHPDMATSYHNLSADYGQLGEYQKQMDFILKALAIREKVLPADHFDLAMTYQNLGWAYENLGEYPRALEFHSKGLSVYEKTLQANDRNLANSYLHQGIIYEKLGEFQKSTEFILKAINIQEKVSPLDPYLASSYSEMAVVYGRLGYYKKQLEFNLKALSIQEKKELSAADSLELALICNNISNSYNHIGEDQKALEFMLKAVAIYENVLPVGHPYLATTYNNLAGRYGNLGEYQKALEFNLKTLSIREKASPADTSALAASYNGLAVTYAYLREHKKAVEFMLKAVAISEKILPADHPDLAMAYQNLSLMYISQKNYEKQLEFGVKALTINKKIRPANHPDLILAHASVGVAFRGIKKYPQSLENLQTAISIGEAAEPKFKNLYQIYSELGFTLIKAHQFPDARSALEKSESLKPAPWLYGYWAAYYAVQNDKSKAIENLQKAISLGFKDLEWVTTDDSLESIRGEKEYLDIVEQLKKK